MSKSCFVSAIRVGQAPLQPRRATCPRRNRLPKCCSNPISGSDDEWLDLARSLSSNKNEKDPERPSPQWEYPDGDNFSKPVEYPDDDGEVLERPWDTWNAALKRDKNDTEKGLPPRDPSAETDFWRDSAREIIPDAPSSPSPEERSALRQAMSDAVPSDPRELWGAASAVTGAVADLQTQLWDELENFNLSDENLSYRDIAREIVSSTAPAELSAPTAVSDSSSEVPKNEASKSGLFPDRTADDQFDASSGSGWNPDVDWKRYDDIARENQMTRDRTERDVARMDAEQLRNESAGGWSAPNDISDEETITYTDVDGKILSAAEVEAAIAEGAMLVDEEGNDLPSDEFDSKSTRSSFTSDGSDQSDGVHNSDSDPEPKPFNSIPSEWSIAPGWQTSAKLDENELPRDSESKSNMWLDVAREVSASMPDTRSSDSDSTNPKSASKAHLHTSGTQPLSDPPMSTGEQGSVGNGDQAEDEGSDAWSSWKSALDAWENAVESAPPRDPKAEVDMWRDAARTIVPEVPIESGAETGITLETSSGKNDSKAEVDMWRGTARAIVPGLQTESDSMPHAASETISEKRESKAEVDMWRDTARTIVPDLPAEADVKPTSDAGTGSAPKAMDDPEQTGIWASWNSANSSWKKSIEHADAEDSRSGASQWRETARELYPDNLKSSENSNSSSSSDWGAPLEPDSSNSNSAWSYWLGDGESQAGTGRNVWWESRLDVAKDRRPVTSAPDESKSGVNKWRSVARDMGTGEGVSESLKPPEDDLGDATTRPSGS